MMLATMTASAAAVVIEVAIVMAVDVVHALADWEA